VDEEGRAHNGAVGKIADNSWAVNHSKGIISSFMNCSAIDLGFLLIVAADCDGRIIYLSKSYQDLLGYKDAELLGKKFDDYFMTSSSAADDEINLLSKARFVACGVEQELRVKPKRGGGKYILARMAAIANPMGGNPMRVFAGLDISERKTLEKIKTKRMVKLKRSLLKGLSATSSKGENNLGSQIAAIWESVSARGGREIDDCEMESVSEGLAMIFSVFDMAGEAIIIVDADGSIRCVNPAFSSMTGYASVETAGMSVSLLSSDLNDAALVAGAEALGAADGRWRMETAVRKKNGEKVRVMMSVSTICPGSRSARRYAIIFTDITNVAIPAAAGIENKRRLIGLHDMGETAHS